MSDKSSIEWCDASWNPVRGCSKVSAGCRNCYAETFSERWRGIKGHPFEQGFDLRLVPGALGLPLTWKRPRRVFVNSMSDLFHDEVPDEYIAAVFSVMAACPQHTFLSLTKRPKRMVEWFQWVEQRGRDGESLFPLDDNEWRIHQMLNVSSRHLGADVPAHHGGPWPLPNVHLGVSAENQERSDERIPLLLKCPAAVRFISAEPLLGPILLDLTGISLVIVGGESGPGARQCDLAWIRGIVEQCQAAHVAAFVKQLGARPAAAGIDVHWAFKSRRGGDMAEWPEDLRIRQYPAPPDRG